MLRKRRDVADARTTLLKEQIKQAAAADAVKRRREQEATSDRKRREQLAEMAGYWQAIERLQRIPSADNAKTAKQAFLYLAKRLHPDQGGSHEAFIHLKQVYDRAAAVWRRQAA